ncbi:methyltransferase family protein [Granulicella aggregans]|uniref:methyltransferase family protein n=1 Tax=Granulicella aggregans TaxID=474949 RepID=UPI0021DF8834|nr:methyltransferase [Granulicella aggregans]
MKASALEFRLRFLVHGVIYVVGYTAPWNYLVSKGAADAGFWSGKAIWLPAALAIERAGWTSLTGAANLLLALGIFFALAGAALRTWGAAYIGSAVVKDGGMHDASAQTAAAGVVADGPYRYMRNPLYVGTMLHTLAVTLLMPLSGAVFVVVAIAVEQMRLISGEEAFLEGKLGERYLEYKRLVPRIVPSLKARVMGSGVRPQWGMAVLGEVYFWGVAVAFASVGMRYNALLVIQGVVVAFGASLVARAFVPKVVTA